MENFHVSPIDIGDPQAATDFLLTQDLDLVADWVTDEPTAPAFAALKTNQAANESSEAKGTSKAKAPSKVSLIIH